MAHSGVRRSPLPRRRAPLRRVGRRTAGRAEERRTLVEAVLRARPRCEYPGCGNRSTDVHERISRARGGSELDPDNVIALDRFHHSWVHDHPAEATELGLLAHSWDRLS